MNSSLMNSESTKHQNKFQEEKEYKQDLISLIEVVHDPLFMLDNQFKLSNFNTAFRNNCIRIFNTYPQKGKYIFDFIPAEYVEMWRLRFLRVIKGDSYELEESYSFRKMNMIYEIRISPVRFNDEIKGIVCFFKDITNRRKNDERFRIQSIDLKRTNEELDLLVYRASHDLRSPLMSMKGLTQIMMLDQKEIQRYLELMNKSIDRLDEFVKEIIEYSKNSRTPVKHERIDFNKIINDIISTHQFVTDNHVNVKVAVKMNSEFYCDESRVKIILNNLISNAFRYSDKTKNSYLKINILCDKEFSSFIFKDNGQGIHHQIKNRIFEMFFRANDNSTGSGLGLYIVKAIVDKVGGSIQVDSQMGRGSTFTVVLPNGFTSENPVIN